MKTLNGINWLTRGKLAVYSAGVTAIAAGAAFGVLSSNSSAASAVAQHSRPNPSQVGQAMQQRMQNLRAHPLTSAQAQAARQKTAARIKAIEQQATQQPPTSLPSGLSQGTLGGPFHGCQFKLQSEYVSPPSGTAKTQILAYAGQNMNMATCQPTYGAVYLLLSDPAAGLTAQDVGVFNSPVASPLKIVSVEGNILNLQALTGQKLTFNLTSHTYAG